MALIPNCFLRKDVTNKVILITGGASGIGRFMADKFASLNAKIVIWDVNEAGLSETVDSINKRMDKQVCFSFKCDISDRKAVYETADLVRQEVGDVDILINNAGIVNGKRFLVLEEDKVERLLDINLKSHFWTIKAFLPSMMSKNSGHVVSIASIAGLSGGCNMTDYCASKFGAVGLMEALMYELRSDGYDGIYTTTVCPWYINTGLFAGVQAGIIPFLDPESVAERIVGGVLRNQEMLFLPRLLYIMNVFKSFLPIKAMVHLFRALNGHRQMDTFVGREGMLLKQQMNNNP